MTAGQWSVRDKIGLSICGLVAGSRGLEGRVYGLNMGMCVQANGRESEREREAEKKDGYSTGVGIPERGTNGIFDAGFVIHWSTRPIVYNRRIGGLGLEHLFRFVKVDQCQMKKKKKKMLPARRGIIP